MAKRVDSFEISRSELRKVLVGSGMADRNIMALFGMLDKAHKHVNAIAFVTILQRMGVNYDKVIIVLRRMGLDDVTISNVMEMVDESKIDSEIGRVYDATIDMG